jgi:hypothetical protein
MFSTKAIHALRFLQRTSRRNSKNKQTKAGRQCPRIVVPSELLRSMLQQHRAAFQSRFNPTLVADFSGYSRPFSSSPMVIPFSTMASFTS